MELFFCSFNTNLLRDKTRWGEGWGQGKVREREREREFQKCLDASEEVSETVSLAQTGTDAILQE